MPVIRKEVNVSTSHFSVDFRGPAPGEQVTMVTLKQNYPKVLSVKCLARYKGEKNYNPVCIPDLPTGLPNQELLNKDVEEFVFYNFTWVAPATPVNVNAGLSMLKDLLSFRLTIATLAISYLATLKSSPDAKWNANFRRAAIICFSFSIMFDALIVSALPYNAQRPYDVPNLNIYDIEAKFDLPMSGRIKAWWMNSKEVANFKIDMGQLSRNSVLMHMFFYPGLAFSVAFLMIRKVEVAQFPKRKNKRSGIVMSRRHRLRRNRSVS